MTNRWKILTALGVSASLVALTTTGCELLALADRTLIPIDSDDTHAGGTGGVASGSGGSDGGSGGTSRTGGTGGVAGAGGGGCDCPQGTDCQEAACDSNGSCSLISLPAETACSSFNGSEPGYCDGSGACAWACLTAADCDTTLNQQCSPTSHSCLPVMCTNDVQDGEETDVDCGGPACDPCDDGLSCLTYADCRSGFCDPTNTCTDCTDDADCPAADTFCDLTHRVNGSDEWCVPRLPDGEMCDDVTGRQCSSGFCPGADGVCCDEACDGTCDACLGFWTGGTDGQCQGVSAGLDPDGECPPDATACRAGGCDVPGDTGTNGCAPAAGPVVCRPSAGACDLAESCDGTNLGCPSDAKSTTVCRPSAGACDLAESCDGSSNSCPPDAKSTAECRPSAGACDLAESCDGSSNSCPADTLKSNGTVCRATTGVCDLPESCTGTSIDCPSDAVLPGGTQCRAVSSAACDVAEYCDGSGGVCPPDGVASSGTVCRSAAGDCDITEYCDGTSFDCPDDALEPSSFVCRAPNGLCDIAETCDGTNPTCPADEVRPATYQCRSDLGPCDAADFCDGTGKSCADGAQAAGTVGTPPCSGSYLCDGTNPTCPTSCAADGDCAGDWWCLGIACAYGHTIAIDGVNDFSTTEEAFITTTAGYTGYVAWDGINLYLGLAGADVASTNGTRYLLAYVAADGAAPTTTTGRPYNAQQPALPFAASHHISWRADATSDGIATLYTTNGAAWNAGTFSGAASRSGSYVEIRIPLDDIGLTTPLIGPVPVSLHLSMINTGTGEGTFAGVPSDSFADSFNPGYLKHYSFSIGGTAVPASHPSI